MAQVSRSKKFFEWKWEFVLTKTCEELNNETICVFACTVIVISAHGKVVRSLLIEAHKKGLTNGDFIFLCFEPYKQKVLFGSFDWKQGVLHYHKSNDFAYLIKWDIAEYDVIFYL